MTVPTDPAAREAWLRELTPLREWLRRERAGVVARCSVGLRDEHYVTCAGIREMAELQQALAAVEAVELERCNAAMGQDRAQQEEGRE